MQAGEAQATHDRTKVRIWEASCGYLRSPTSQALLDPRVWGSRREVLPFQTRASLSVPRYLPSRLSS